MDLSAYIQREFNAIGHRLIAQPGKYLDWATTLEVFAHLRHQSPVHLELDPPANYFYRPLAFLVLSLTMRTTANVNNGAVLI